MYFFVNDRAIQDLEGIQVDAFVEREDGIADGGIDGQAEVLLRGARGRSWVTMPVGENLQTLAAGISQCSKLILWSKREMLWRVVDVLHPVVLCHDITFRAAGAQQIAARFIGCVLLGLADQFINDFLWYLHFFNVQWSMFRSPKGRLLPTGRKNGQCFKSQAACS